MFKFQCGENSGPFSESHVGPFCIVFFFLNYITYIFKVYHISSIYLLRLTSLALHCRYMKPLLVSLQSQKALCALACDIRNLDEYITH